MELGLNLGMGRQPKSAVGAPDPSAGYALYLDFKNSLYRSGATKVSTISTVPGYTYTRSGAKSELNGTASPVAFAANVPGIVPAIGYWSRAALTNLELNSQQFGSQALSGCTVTADTTVAPDGTTTADTIVSTGTGPAVQNSPAVTTTTYTTSRYFKRGTPQWAYIQINDGSGANAAFVTFDLVNGTIGTPQTLVGTLALTPYIVNAGGGYYRCMVVWANPSGTVASVFSGMANAVNTRTAANADTLIAWQAQTIAGNFPDGGPIIATTGATASTGADVQSETLAALTDQDQIIFVKANAASYNTNACWLEMDDGTAGNYIRDRYNSATASTVVVAASSFVHVFNTALPAVGTDFTVIFQRTGANWRSGVYSAGSITWGAAAAAGAFPVGLVNVRVGHDNGGTSADSAIKSVGIKVGTFANDAAIIAALF